MMAVVTFSDVDLTGYNTLGLPSKASVFTEIKSPDDLPELVKLGYFDDTPPLILGGGSNILIKKDLTRPVVKVSIPGIHQTKIDDVTTRVSAGAGVNWHNLVTWAVDNNYGGIENLALIPGTVGAAPIQNIGAYGVELEQLFHSLELFDLRDQSFKTFFHDDCKFGYRDSVFKRELKGKVIITKVHLHLKTKNYKSDISYKSLDNYLAEKGIHDAGIRDVFDAVVAIRKSKLPDPSLMGNAGSFFKNPVIENSVYQTIRKKYPGVPSYPMDDEHKKIPAGWLIEQAGWKGKRVGNVGTYKNQALVIVNHGGATGDEVFHHAMKIRESVKQKFGVELVPEVNIVE